jgi:hypothetical protein
VLSKGFVDCSDSFKNFGVKPWVSKRDWPVSTICDNWFASIDLCVPCRDCPDLTGGIPSVPKGDVGGGAENGLNGRDLERE